MKLQNLYDALFTYPEYDICIRRNILKGHKIYNTDDYGDYEKGRKNFMKSKVSYGVYLCVKVHLTQLAWNQCNIVNNSLWDLID